MKEIPILFTTEMVQAILKGRKTQTRRILNPQSVTCHQEKYAVNDLLYVRETFAYLKPMTEHHAPRENVVFKTGGDGELSEWDKSHFEDEKWRPNIHMPKKFSRIWMEITGVRIERVQDIGGGDALAEGSYLVRCPCLPKSKDRAAIDLSFNQHYCHIHGTEFRNLWESINGKREVKGVSCAWDANPWVWAITFEVIDR